MLSYCILYFYFGIQVESRDDIDLKLYESISIGLSYKKTKSVSYLCSSPCAKVELHNENIRLRRKSTKKP